MNIKNLDEYIIEDIENSDHPSDFVKRDGFSALILRLPEVNSNVVIKSLAFLIEGKTVYRYSREVHNLQELGDISNLQELLEEKIEKLIKDIKLYHIDIDNLEESLYDTSLDANFMQKWLKYKKDVSLINRLMFHASIVIELFISHLKKEFNGDFDKNAFEDLHEEIGRVRDLAKAGVEKLDYLYDFYRAKVDEKMNKNVYYLTLLSGIFLPLTLLTGFFGMNTGGLPWVNDPLGTWKVVAVSIVLEIIFFLPFILQNMKKIQKFKRN